MATANPIMLPNRQKALTRRTVIAGLSLSITPLAQVLPTMTSAQPLVADVGYAVLALPFVRDRTAAELATGATPRCFWSVHPSGIYGADCETGAAYAALALNCMARSNLPQLLQWAVFDMMALNRRHSGVEVGFLSVFGQIARQAHGASKGATA